MVSLLWYYEIIYFGQQTDLLEHIVLYLVLGCVRVRAHVCVLYAYGSHVGVGILTCMYSCRLEEDVCFPVLVLSALFHASSP